MRFEDGLSQVELQGICSQLQSLPIGEIVEQGPYFFYRRGSKGLWLYRVAKEDYKVSVEKRAKFVKGKQIKLLE